MKLSNLKLSLFTRGLLIILFISGVVGLFIFYNSRYDFYTSNSGVVSGETASVIEKAVESLAISPHNINPLTGVSCENYNRRPLAVVMASDPVARPLSGISSADWIIEMPVITGSVTRMIAFFICDEASEIGALRSARHDFIPLTMGLDGILVHWGGSHIALDKLNRGVMDNIDALINLFGTFYRKSGVPAPHNGFSSYARLWSAANKLGYRQETNFNDYYFSGDDRCEVCENGQLSLDYAYPYNVFYDYNYETNVYLRLRGGYPEMDKLNNRQVEVKNIVVMRAASRQIEGQYNDVDVEGAGEIIFYKNGKEISGRWEKNKNDPASKLYFFDEEGREIEFTVGKTIIEIVEPYQRVEYILKRGI